MKDDHQISSKFWSRHSGKFFRNSNAIKTEQRAIRNFIVDFLQYCCRGIRPNLRRSNRFCPPKILNCNRCRGFSSRLSQLVIIQPCYIVTFYLGRYIFFYYQRRKMRIKKAIKTIHSWKKIMQIQINLGKEMRPTNNHFLRIFHAPKGN